MSSNCVDNITSINYQSAFVQTLTHFSVFKKTARVRLLISQNKHKDPKGLCAAFVCVSNIHSAML